MVLQAGKLDRRIRIERTVSIDDGYQTRDGAWTPLATVWAQFIPSAGKEARDQAARAETLPASFRIRYSSQVADVSPKDRVRLPAADDGRVFDIVSVVPIGRREGLELICVAGRDG